MYFDALTMAAVADELREKVLGGRVQKVLLPAPPSLGLEIYAQQERHYLLASAHAQAERDIRLVKLSSYRCGGFLTLASLLFVFIGGVDGRLEGCICRHTVAYVPF